MQRLSLNISDEHHAWFQATARKRGMDYTNYLRRMFNMHKLIEQKRDAGYDIAFVKGGKVEVIHFI